MKQQQLIHRVYQACREHDANKISKLREMEFEKIFKRRSEGKPFSAAWTVVRI